MKGTQVGSYIIEEKIGEGGMGVVYSAKHARMNQQAVVKVLRKHLVESPDIARRFENEANAAASIGHPGIVQVFDIGQQEDGSLYIVMELLAGESLQDRLDRLGKLPVEQAVRIANQCADALGAAHAKGITHRDLKPDNIFLVPDSLVAGGERAKLLDFGIAKLQVDGMATMGTAMGTLMGTPPYMSPEQCQGAGGVQNSSDLYSLGCILFQLVAGRTPFVGKGPGDYIVAHTTQPPPLLRTYAPHAPLPLQEIVSMLLAKNPEERFASCAALGSALSSVPGGDSPSSAGPVAISTGPGAPAHIATGAEAPRMAQTNLASGHSNLPAAGVAAAAAPSAVQGQPGALPGTTLGLSAGESGTAPSMHRTRDDQGYPKQGGGKAKVVAMAAVLTIAVAGVGFAVLSGGADKSKSTVEVGAVTDAQVEMVRLTLKLKPAHAEVYVAGTLMPPSGDASASGDGGEGVERVIEVPRGSEAVLEVRSPGFETSQRTIDASSNQSLAITLENPERTLEAQRAKLRRSEWTSSRVKTSLSMEGKTLSSKGTFKIDADDESKLTMRYDGVNVVCGVVFGEDGNPSKLTYCKAIGEEFSVKATSFECSPAGKRLVCKASRLNARLEGKSVRPTLKVSRALGDADATSETKVDAAALVPIETADKPTRARDPIVKPAPAPVVKPVVEPVVTPTKDLAQERTTAWMSGTVGALFRVDGDNMPTRGKFQDAKGKTLFVMQIEGDRVSCEVKFGRDGNPRKFVGCEGGGTILRFQQNTFRCALAGRRLVCRVPNFTVTLDGETMGGSFRVQRPAIAADRGSGK
jgi:serine/threonine-protein kinase